VWEDRRTLHLDRHKLEKEGRLWHGFQEFTLAPQEGNDFAGGHSSWLDQQAAVLGLTWPCDRRSVVRAFRAKAKQVHPDKGGSEADFIAAREAYTRLIEIAQFEVKGIAA
jgi:hypothetical protein